MLASLTSGNHAAVLGRAGFAAAHNATPFPQIASHVLRVARDTELYAEGSPAHHVYQVLSGAVRTCKLLGDGRRQIGFFALPGDWIGLDAATRHLYAAEAVKTTVLLCFSRRELDALARTEPTAAQLVQNVLREGLAAAERRILMFGRKTAMERMASFLADMDARLADGRGCFTLPMARGDIADYLGLTTETVSRMLSELRRRRAIALEGTQSVRILDRAWLEGLSGEETPRYSA